MNEKLILGNFNNDNDEQALGISAAEVPKMSHFIPDIQTLQTGVEEAGRLVDDIVLKKYLHRLSDLDVIPLDKSMKNIGAVRLFKINEMVYQSNEYSIYKFASVFNAVQNLNCGVFILVYSDGSKTDFYMGVRSLDDMRTTKSLKDTLCNTLNGQFPGVKTEDLFDSQVQELLAGISDKNIASVSCVAANKDLAFKDNDSFVQGLEKLAFAMQGRQYTAIIMAKSSSPEQLDEIRSAYENIYTQISPFANMQVSYGKNTALSVSEALSKGLSLGKSYSESFSVQKGVSDTTSSSQSTSEAKKDNVGSMLKRAGQVALGAASVITAPLTGGASLAVAGGLLAGAFVLDAYEPKTVTTGSSSTVAHNENRSTTRGETEGTNETRSENATHTRGVTNGSSETIQLTTHNKALQDIMDRIDHQLKRIDECESIGMWESAAYFLSDTHETAEMAAGTYKAIMNGEGSEIETSSVNLWGRRNKDKLPLLHDYITSFIHPVFKLDTRSVSVPVTAASLVSSNELAIQMGLPRKSVCGLPVIQHADFGKEVVRYSSTDFGRELCLGNVFSMGKDTPAKVTLDCESFSMHTFITGSTGSGKSNAVCHILDEMLKKEVPFLVVEPAKGEYKDKFGHRKDVRVFGTNNGKSELLKINPFSFPDDVHVLEHIDRLIEIFNVCWPMYAAMPAVLKDAIERSYILAGWDLNSSECKYALCGKPVYPTFSDVLLQINAVIDSSQYSADSKGDYKGSLCTRIKSLTNGLYRRIFTSNEIPPNVLFDSNVIVDLSRTGSSETKSLIMGLLVMKLQEHRMACKTESNSALRHLTVLEEAHNLLKRMSTEQTSEGANLFGKSVEMLANSIAEMRTYGEGFVIADQAPGLLDMAAIRNTNTKIILRLPDISDRELVGKSASLSDNQILELSKLKTGIAAVYQNDWTEPVLCHVSKCLDDGTRYEYQAEVEKDTREYLAVLIDYLMLSCDEKKEVSGDKANQIFDALNELPLSASVKTDVLKFMIADDFQTHRKLRESAVYKMFNSSEALSLARIEGDSIYLWYTALSDALFPKIDALDQIQQDRIIAIIALKQVEEFKTSGNIELFNGLMDFLDRRQRIL